MQTLYTCTAPSTFETLERVVDEVQELASDAGWDEDLAFRVTLLVSEALSNAIEHGNRLDADLDVKVELSQGPSQIRVMVEDEGEGFVPPQGDQVPDAHRTRGRGLFLMHEMADHVEFRGDGRSVVLLVER